MYSIPLMHEKYLKKKCQNNYELHVHMGEIQNTILYTIQLNLLIPVTFTKII